MNHKELVAQLGTNLSGCNLEQLTEVYKVDDDGRKSKTIGHFRDPVVAQAFTQQQADSFSFKTREVSALVCSDNIVGFIVGEQITLVNDERTALEVRANALRKLTPEEQKVLGL